MSRPIARCRECGGTHTPHCTPATKREEGAIWAGILASPEAQARKKQRALARHRAADPHCTCNDCVAFHFTGENTHE